jgi:anti-sigma factor RsiW
MSRRELSCREFIEFIAGYLELELADAELRRFEAHLAVCPECVSYLDGYRQTQVLQACAFDPDAPVPETVPGELVSAILDARRKT